MNDFLENELYEEASERQRFAAHVAKAIERGHDMTPIRSAELNHDYQLYSSCRRCHRYVWEHADLGGTHGSATTYGCVS